MSSSSSFIIRSHERGYNKLDSEILASGAHPMTMPSSYVSGHPGAFITRHSSFNFHEYQTGIPGFGKIRVFGEEIFSPNGAGYNMHPHHNFIIMALVLKGTLTHLNNIGKIDSLKADDYYLFSAGSGGKHCEVNIDAEHEMHGIYIWLMPDKLYAPPQYHRSHFDRQKNANKIVTLIGNGIAGALPVEQDFKLSRLVSNGSKIYTYKPTSTYHGMYFFVLAGEIEIEKNLLEKGDSMGVHGITSLDVLCKMDETEILILETVM